jgi:hypothetical protein
MQTHFEHDTSHDIKFITKDTKDFANFSIGTKTTIFHVAEEEKEEEFTPYTFEFGKKYSKRHPLEFFDLPIIVNKLTEEILALKEENKKIKEQLELLTN